MKILITGICGFVGYNLAKRLLSSIEGVKICGIDSLIRSGTEVNRTKLLSLGCRLFHGDVRQPSDFENLPEADWVIDAAANPSVLAGLDGRSSSRQVIEHNLLGTVNTLEFCRRNRAGLILLSTSRVYSISKLSQLPLQEAPSRFVLDSLAALPNGVSTEGIREGFSTEAPVSLYGATKLSSEILALEYSHAFGFPVWINRCGVLAGAGQFGTAEQGIFSYWIHAWHSQRPLRYIGFNGSGHQVRDAFHPADLGDLLIRQLRKPGPAENNRIWNLGGGAENAMSLAELSTWCAHRFGPREVERDPSLRPYDLPWVIIDSAAARNHWSWKPTVDLESILEEIALHAGEQPDWMTKCGV